MRDRIGRSTSALGAVFFFLSSFALAQAKPEQAPNLAQLELTFEVAATTTDGPPAAIRTTLKNVGINAVDLPMPGLGCSGPDGYVQFELDWRSSDPDNHTGFGSGCAGGITDRPKLIDRARNEWIRLQPGEFLTFTQSVRSDVNRFGPGSVEYWVEYIPPRFTAEERAELIRSGFLPPSEPLKTESRKFSIQ